MGYFRKLKKNKFTLDECRRLCDNIIQEMTETTDYDRMVSLAKDWAVARELQARHEGENNSDVD